MRSRCTYVLVALIGLAWGSEQSLDSSWHKALIGVPSFGAPSTAPILSGSAVYTATDKNIVASLNSTDGSLLWRHIFDKDDPVISFQQKDTLLAALSGSQSSTVRVFDSRTGNLVVEKRLSEEAPTPGSFDSAFSAKGELFVLYGGSSVQALSSASKSPKWTWTSTEKGSLVKYSTILVEKDAIYVVGLSSSFASYTLHVTALSLATGEVISDVHVPSSIQDPTGGYVVAQVDQGASIAWVESSVVKSFALTPELGSKASSTAKGSKYVKILPLNSLGQVVAVEADGSTRVVSLDIPNHSASASSHGESFFAASASREVVRVSQSQVTKTFDVEVFSPTAAQQDTYTVSFNTEVYGPIGHVAFGGDSSLLITSKTGALQFWRKDQVVWTREESLASIVVSEFVELPERKVVSLRAGEEEPYVQKLVRQLKDLQDLPHYIVAFVTRFVTGSYATASSSPEGLESLSRDAFGFRKIIVAATRYGSVFGIDSSNGKILWSRILSVDDEDKILPAKLVVTQTGGEGDEPQVVLVGEKRQGSGKITTIVYHIHALTGEDAQEIPSTNVFLEGTEIIDGPLLGAYPLDSTLRTVVLIDESLQVYTYPSTLQSAVSSSHVPLQVYQSNGEFRLVGHQVVLDTMKPTWTFSPPEGEKVVSIVPPSRGPIASVGKVLGNRTTLYKYLNPNVFIALTEGPASSGISLVDGAKGTVLYQATLPAGAGVKAALTENWLVYHYYDSEFAAVGSTKGYRIVSVEMYEGKGLDEKTSSSDLSSFSAGSQNVHFHEQSFIYSEGVSAIATTSTKFGVSSKDIIVATLDGKIQSLSRRFLDPRRPDHKPSAEEQEEFLIQYDPVMPLDPRRILSRNSRVFNVRHIITSPSLLESTSLVFAYGDSDLFFVRVAPSNTFDLLSESFNKLQLVLTVCGLAIAIPFTSRLVSRKKLREQWYL